MIADGNHALANHRAPSVVAKLDGVESADADGLDMYAQPAEPIHVGGGPGGGSKHTTNQQEAPTPSLKGGLQRRRRAGVARLVEIEWDGACEAKTDIDGNQPPSMVTVQPWAHRGHEAPGAVDAGQRARRQAPGTSSKLQRRQKPRSIR